MMKYLIAAAAVGLMTTVASAQSIQYPAGTSAGARVAHEAQRANAARTESRLRYSRNCVKSADGFSTCDPDPQVRLNFRKGTQTQGGGGGGSGSGGGGGE